MSKSIFSYKHFRSYIEVFHLFLIFFHIWCKWSSLILLCVAVQFSQYHLLKRLSFPHCCKLPISVWVISALSTLFPWSVCLILCQKYTIWMIIALFQIMDTSCSSFLRYSWLMGVFFVSKQILEYLSQFFEECYVLIGILLNL